MKEKGFQNKNKVFRYYYVKVHTIDRELVLLFVLTLLFRGLKIKIRAEAVPLIEKSSQTDQTFCIIFIVNVWSTVNKSS